MKHFILGSIAGLLVGGLAGWWLAPASSPYIQTPTTQAEPSKLPSAVNLSAEQFSAAGIVTATPSPVRLANYTTGYARVIDPTPLFLLVAELETAEAAFLASGKELTRLRQLNATSDNASARAVEAAESAALRDRSLLASAQARIRAGWGDSLGESKSRAALLPALTMRETALVRVDIAAGEIPTQSPRTLQLERLTGNSGAEQAAVLGTVPQADYQFQGGGHLAVMKSPPPPGTLLRALIPSGGDDTAALSVPASAVFRHHGQTLVYVETAPRTYERRSVTLGRAFIDAVPVVKGLAATDLIVVTGAQQLLSHEQLGAQTGL